jgi:hypothetical protein
MAEILPLPLPLGLKLRNIKLNINVINFSNISSDKPLLDGRKIAPLTLKTLSTVALVAGTVRMHF